MNDDDPDQPAGQSPKQKTMDQKIEAYFDGYRRSPDGDDPDFIAMEDIGLKDMATDEEWPEAPDDNSSRGVSSGLLGSEQIAGTCHQTLSAAARSEIVTAAGERRS